MKMSSTFRWHNATQFLGALNDNVFQGLMIFFLIGCWRNKKADINALRRSFLSFRFAVYSICGNTGDRFSKSRLSYWPRPLN
jgi:hypothetical protein